MKSIIMKIIDNMCLSERANKIPKSKLFNNTKIIFKSLIFESHSLVIFFLKHYQGYFMPFKFYLFHQS